MHQIGLPSALTEICEIAKRHGLMVMEDAACAIGSEYKGQKIGHPYSSIACFSFHPRKILTTGDGGMITTANEEFAARMRRLRAQLDLAPRPRARLWDLLQRERVLLEEAIAERSGREPLWNAAAAHITMMIIAMAFDHERDSLDETAPGDYADRIIAMLHGSGSPIPARG